jgi:hypothetical protein
MNMKFKPGDNSFSRRLSLKKGFATRTLSEFEREPLLLVLKFQLTRDILFLVERFQPWEMDAHLQG